VICPACKNDMIVVEYNSIELDYCNDCYGVWFDSGELELLLKSISLDTSDLLKNILDTREAKLSETRRRCPMCRQKMRETTLGQKPRILVDACRQGHGLWFDGGEVQELLKQLAEKPSAKQDSQQKVVGFLGEVFKAQR